MFCVVRRCSILGVVRLCSILGVVRLCSILGVVRRCNFGIFVLMRRCRWRRGVKALPLEGKEMGQFYAFLRYQGGFKFRIDIK